MKNLYKLYYKAKISFWNTFKTEWKSIKSDKAVVSTFLSVAFIILSIFCAKPNRLNKAATKIKDIFFIIYFLLLNSKGYLPSVKDSSFL